MSCAAFKIEHSADGLTWVQIDTVAQGTTVYQTALTGNFRVRGYVGSTNSAYSNQAAILDINGTMANGGIGNIGAASQSFGLIGGSVTGSVGIIEAIIAHPLTYRFGFNRKDNRVIGKVPAR